MKHVKAQDLTLVYHSGDLQFLICNKDFVSLGRHSWRCRGRRTQQQSSESDTRNFGKDQDSNFERSNLTIEPSLQQTSIANIHHVSCGCGKKCKGPGGLKTHQRTCRFVMGLNEELIQPEKDNELETNDIEDLISTSSNPDLKPGVKLPQTEPEWAFTEDFLRLHLNIADIQSDSDLDALLTNMNDTIYGFLAKELSRLKKFESDNVNKVKFVARLLRKKLSGNLNSTSKVTPIDHNAEITKNFWKYVKNYVEGEKSDNQKPSFCKKKCVGYFKSAFKV